MATLYSPTRAFVALLRTRWRDRKDRQAIQ